MGDNYDSPLFYSLLIDPLLKSVQEKVSTFIKEDTSLIDISCGTGSFSKILSKKCRTVTGVDISPAMTSFAEKKCRKDKINNITFINEDFLKLKKDNVQPAFDYAVLSMAIHQFDKKLRVQFLEKANEIAGRVFILDYSCPIKPGKIKILINGIEHLAGKKHFRNFKSYNAENGIISILEKNNFKNIKNHDTGRDIFRIVSYGKDTQ